MDSTYYELVSRDLFVPATKTQIENYLHIDLDNWIYETSGTDNYVATGLETGIDTISGYTADMTISILVHNTNTGASTIDIDNNGAIALTDINGNALVAGSLQANNIYTFRYDGVQFVQIVSGGEANIFGLLVSILETFERITGLDYFRKTWDLYLDYLPEWVQIKKTPLVSLDNIEFNDDTLGWRSITYDAQVVRLYPYCKVILNDAELTNTDKYQAYRYIFTSGYGSLQDDVRTAMLMTLGSIIENNGECLDPSIGCKCDKSMIPAQARLITGQYRIQEI